MTVTDTAPALLHNKAILIVEDETIVSFLIEDMLGELGCREVWQASDVSEALALLDTHKPDAVVLDANLSGQFTFPIATRLAQANIPFVFATGYGRSGIPNEWMSRPVIQKPFTIETLEAALRGLLT
jgi:CheY-like chemotaxis protein